MKKKLVILIFFLLLFLLYVCNIDSIPNSIILLNNEVLDIRLMNGISIENEQIVNTSSNIENSVTKLANVKMCGITVKKISITELPDIEVIPVGKLIGIRMYTKGVLVVGVNDNEQYKITNIKEGDTIVSINDKKVETIQNIKDIVQKSKGKDIKIKYVRNNNEVLTSTLSPIKTEDSKEYKIGLWVKEGATGVGTISFYNPQSNEFAALGHGVYDKDTGYLLEIEKGEIYDSKIVSITKGEYGNTGEIRGSILKNKLLGNINKNTEFGIYGVLKKQFDENSKVKVASRNEIQIGDAYILGTLDNNETEKYNIKIESIDKSNNINNRSMKIRITDKKLIEKTGGIICGMSGCPIIQNNKLIGVVTNVLVNNSEIGYGVFADLMIKEMVK